MDAEDVAGSSPHAAQQEWEHRATERSPQHDAHQRNADREGNQPMIRTVIKNVQICHELIREKYRAENQAEREPDNNSFRTTLYRSASLIRLKPSLG